MNSPEDIIAAIATPAGDGALAVLRVSGSGSIELVDKLFEGRIKLLDARTQTVHFGKFINESREVLDEVLVTVFRAPHSYTAEDVVEISCHGSIFIARRLLDTLVQKGARNADPGEFTKRAFLNGRIDLSQAEAVADMIRSRSELAQRSSLMQLQGGISEHINNLRTKLLTMSGRLELELDFSEEGLELLDRSDLDFQLREAISLVDHLEASYTIGKVIRDGVRVVLVGRPNVGKSSIFNKLLLDNRSIVTDVPGTTRDTIQESVRINGIIYSISDTAGLRESFDVVETEGMRRTEQIMSTSDLIMFCFDATSGFTNEDLKRLNRAQQLADSSTKIIIVQNKLDLIECKGGPELLHYDQYPVVHVSALTGFGLDDLRRQMETAVYSEDLLFADKNLVLTNDRQHGCLRRASRFLRIALDDILAEKSGEIVAISLIIAIDALGEITGIISSEDILNNIFSSFCIGK